MPNNSAGTYTPEYRCVSYIEPFLIPGELRKHIRMAKTALKHWEPEYDAIAFRGMSGALIAPPVARELNKSLIMVRKPGEDSHSPFDVEGDHRARRYIIVDDFISSGRTAYTILRAIKKFSPKAECLGLLDVWYLRAKTLREHSGKKFPLHRYWMQDSWLKDQFDKDEHGELEQREPKVPESFYLPATSTDILKKREDYSAETLDKEVGCLMSGVTEEPIDVLQQATA